MARRKVKRCKYKYDNTHADLPLFYVDGNTEDAVKEASSEATSKQKDRKRNAEYLTTNIAKVI